MALVAAARTGDVSTVRRLIAQGVDVEQVEDGAWEGDVDSTTALMWASMNSHREIVQLLLQAGANPESRDEDSMTALMLAGMEGHKEVVWSLLESNTKVDVQDSDGRSALHHSACYGHVSVVGLLLSKGANIELKDEAGYTALMTAHVCKFDIVVGMLLSCGALPQLVGRDMSKAEQEASASKYSDWVGSEVFVNLDAHKLEDINTYLTAHAGSADATALEQGRRGVEANALKLLNEAISARDVGQLEAAIATADAASEEFEFIHDYYVKEAKDHLQLTIYEDEKKADPESVRIYVVPREVVIESRLQRRLHSFQGLLSQNKLRVLRVNRIAALQGSLRTGECKVVALTYPWQGQGDPDSTNDRLDAVAQFLDENQDIDAIWWDWSCIPQESIEEESLTRFEKMYYDDMLQHGVWLIYLSAQVLCILSPQSMIRFWPQLELYLGTRAVTSSGLEPSFERLQVRAIQSLAASSKEQEAALCAKWSSASSEEAIDMLDQSPASRSSDRVRMLKTLPEIEREYLALVKDLPPPTLSPWTPSFEERIAAPTGPSAHELELELELKTTREEIETLRAQLSAEKDLREASMSGKEEEMKKMFEELKRLEAVENELLAVKKEAAIAKKDLDEATTNLTQVQAKFASEVGRLETTLATEAAQSKILRNQMEDMKGQIRVYARCRPMAAYELEKGCTNVVKVVDDSGVETETDRGRKKEFEFNKVFDPSASQESVFAECKTLVQSVIDGFNVCIFAYGQTGSGKTFTMTGSDDNPDLYGLTPRAINGLFDRLEGMKGAKARISSYCIELYNDELVDLYHKMVNKGKKKVEPNKLDIKLDAKKMVVVKGATVLSAADAKEMKKQFDKSNEMRHVGATLMNAGSSRSHSIFTILVEVTSSVSKRTTTGKLSLVDLAGSERMNKTGATGDRMKEALSINKSLSALGDVIAALSAGESFVPYRNNKLTQLMQDSLGGNAKTLMFVNFSPADYNRDESIAALTYAQRVKKITNTASKNADPEEVAELKATIADLQAKLKGAASGSNEEQETVS